MCRGKATSFSNDIVPTLPFPLASADSFADDLGLGSMCTSYAFSCLQSHAGSHIHTHKLKTPLMFARGGNHIPFELMSLGAEIALLPLGDAQAQRIPLTPSLIPLKGQNSR